MSDNMIVERLEQAGLEIEQYSVSKTIDKKVVVALVKNVVQHPNADKLHLVDVDMGGREVRVVCGAPNVRPGINVALAQVGATLPGGEVIAAAKLRGETSEGMLCSEAELALGSDHSGIMELSEGVVLGTSLCDIYPADASMEVKTHANRFDLLSVTGLAREVAAMSGGAMKDLPDGLASDGKGPELAKGAQAARIMVARLDVKPGGPSPAGMVSRLRAAGVRSISPIVDVTNYVNLEMGQPLHAYDAAKVKLPLAVRPARAGEKLTTLDGVERKLTPEDLVVSDANGPVGLAGVMGGAGTEVGPETTEILLEAAVFDGVAVRKMAKRHGLRTEASARFERGLPVELPPVAMARAVALLGEVAGGQLTGVSDQLNRAAERRSVSVEHEFMQRLLGFEVTAKEAAKALGQLQMEAEVADGGQTITVATLPWWRTDIREGQDLVEEVVRVLGYDRVPSVVPTWQPQVVEFDQKRPRQRWLRQVLYGAGLFEVMTYSFVGDEALEELGLDLKKHLKLQNPMNSEQGYLRSSLLASQLAVLERNRTYAKELAYYELSKVFVARGRGQQPDEPLHLAVTVVRPDDAYRHVKGVLDAVARELHVNLSVVPEEAEAWYMTGRSGTVMLDGKAVGRIGQLDAELLLRRKTSGEAAYLELDADRLLAASKPASYSRVDRFPSAMRDVAVVVSVETPWQAVAEALADLPNAQVRFVSDYYGAGLADGHKSLALRLSLSHPDRTPTDAEAADLEQKALAILKRRFGAVPRDAA